MYSHVKNPSKVRWSSKWWPWWLVRGWGCSGWYPVRSILPGVKWTPLSVQCDYHCHRDQESRQDSQRKADSQAGLTTLLNWWLFKSHRWTLICSECHKTSPDWHTYPLSVRKPTNQTFIGRWSDSHLLESHYSEITSVSMSHTGAHLIRVSTEASIAKTSSCILGFILYWTCSSKVGLCEWYCIWQYTYIQ